MLAFTVQVILACRIAELGRPLLLTAILISKCAVSHPEASKKGFWKFILVHLSGKGVFRQRFDTLAYFRVTRLLSPDRLVISVEGLLAYSPNPCRGLGKFDQHIKISRAILKTPRQQPEFVSG